MFGGDLSVLGGLSVLQDNFFGGAYKLGRHLFMGGTSPRRFLTGVLWLGVFFFLCLFAGDFFPDTFFDKCLHTVSTYLEFSKSQFYNNKYP